MILTKEEKDFIVSLCWANQNILKDDKENAFKDLFYGIQKLTKNSLLEIVMKLAYSITDSDEVMTKIYLESLNELINKKEK